MHTPTRPGTRKRARAHTHKHVVRIGCPLERLANAPQCYVIRTLPVLIYQLSRYGNITKLRISVLLVNATFSVLNKATEMNHLKVTANYKVVQV